MYNYTRKNAAETKKKQDIFLRIIILPLIIFNEKISNVVFIWWLAAIYFYLLLTNGAAGFSLFKTI